VAAAVVKTIVALVALVVVVVVHITHRLVLVQQILVQVVVVVGHMQGVEVVLEVLEL